MMIFFSTVEKLRGSKSLREFFAPLFILCDPAFFSKMVLRLPLLMTFSFLFPYLIFIIVRSHAHCIMRNEREWTCICKWRLWNAKFSKPSTKVYTSNFLLNIAYRRHMKIKISEPPFRVWTSVVALIHQENNMLPAAATTYLKQQQFLLSFANIQSCARVSRTDSTFCRDYFSARQILRWSLHFCVGAVHPPMGPQKTATQQRQWKSHKSDVYMTDLGSWPFCVGEVEMSKFRSMNIRALGLRSVHLPTLRPARLDCFINSDKKAKVHWHS